MSNCLRHVSRLVTCRSRSFKPSHLNFPMVNSTTFCRVSQGDGVIHRSSIDSDRPWLHASHYRKLSVSARCIGNDVNTSVADIHRHFSPDIERSGKKVAVLVSGGVDSSVALRILQESGSECTGYYLKIWFQEDFVNYWSECPWEEDINYAQAVCDQAGVELRVVHLTEEYWSRVVSHCVTEMKSGRTPNPDVLCNSRVKFGAFFDHIDFNEFDFVASGHYARTERLITVGADGQAVETVHLKTSPDDVKDQTYFLSHLTQQQLQRVLFPLGNLAKNEVRKIAEAMDLPTKNRKDSQGICFLGKVKFNEFVAQHLGSVKGRILESETGTFLGVHNGFWFHTIGQRTGLGLSGGPWYVVAKDLKNNVVFVSRSYYSPDKCRRMFRVGNFVWITGVPPDTQMASNGLKCKVRHGPKMYSCTLQFEDSPSTAAQQLVAGAHVGLVTLAEDDQGLAPGQYAAFYSGDTCLGSGVILEALGGDTNVPSDSAKEVARLSWSPDDVKKASSKKKKKEAVMAKDKSSEEVSTPSGVETLINLLNNSATCTVAS